MTKPLDLESVACRPIIDLADRRNLILAVDFESRYLADNHRIRSALGKGAIGEIVLADLRMK